MTRDTLWRFMLLLFVMTGALGIGARDARAQWGMDFGFMGFNQVPRPGDFINQQALANAGRATMGPVSRPVYANNPNSYLNRVRDNGFTSHYSLNSRRSPALSTARRSSNSSQASNNQPQPETPTAPAPVIPIGSFFNAARKLVWPGDAPVAGDLGAKRDISDEACLTVADLVEKFRSAPITTVTVARQKLIDYGQPALQKMRDHSTPQMADTFHFFMLSLYDSLAQAAEAPAISATSNSAP